MRFFVAISLVLAACVADPDDLNADGRVDCRDLHGVFQIRQMRFAAVHEPGRVVSFDRGTLEFVLYDATFSTVVPLDGKERRTEGRAHADFASALTVLDGLVPGAAPGDQPLVCDYDPGAGTLSLKGEVRYDFPGDGVGLVAALLTLEAVRVNEPAP